MQRKLITALLVTTIAISVVGCGKTANVKIDKDLTMNIEQALYLTPGEYNMYTVTGDTKETWEHVTYGDAEYYKTKESIKQTASEFNKTENGKVTSDYVILNLPVNTEFSDFLVTCPFDVAYTNGHVSLDNHDEVFFRLDDLGDTSLGEYSQVYYAVKDKKILEAKDITFNGIVDCASGRKAKRFSIKTSGVVGNVEVFDGKSRYCLDPTLDSYVLKGDGKYKIGVTLLGGASDVLTYTIDSIKPQTNVKNKVTYKEMKLITFKDDLSGVRCALLDGKHIKSGKIITTKGVHSLHVYDNAGNVTKRVFTIK